MHPQREIEVELATAYNRWLVEQVLPHEPRMKAMLYLPFNTPEAAEEMVKRFLGAPGVVGFLVTCTRYQPVHANEYMRLYAMLEEASMPIGFHAAPQLAQRLHPHLNRFLSMHAISLRAQQHRAHDQLGHQRPAGALPEAQDDVDRERPRLAAVPDAAARPRVPDAVSEAPLLKRLPSEYMQRDVLHHAADGGDEPQAAGRHLRGDPRRDQLLYASDWPHWDFDVPAKVFDLPFLDDQAKRNILGLNAARLFNLDPGEISPIATDGGRIVMKITRITPFATALPLRRPMKTGGEEMTKVENIFVRIDTDEGLTGWGEASSAPRMTGETVASIMEAIRFLTPALEGREPRNSAGNLAEMDKHMYGNASAKALELALYDIAGKAAGKPVAELLGDVMRTRMPVLWMLASGETRADIEDGREKIAAGYTAFKIKVGINPVESDIERAIASGPRCRG